MPPKSSRPSGPSKPRKWRRGEGGSDVDEEASDDDEELVADKSLKPRRRTDAATNPLPDDQPVPERATRKKSAARKTESQTRKKKSTDDVYKSAHDKWWVAFIAYAGWDAEPSLVWTDSEGNITADGKFRQFYVYLHGCVGMTKHIFKRCIFWAERTLNDQLEEGGFPPVSEYITQLSGVRALKDEIYTNQRTQRVEGCEDLHARIEGVVGPEQMIALAKQCLLMEVPSASHMLDHSNTLLELRMTFEVPSLCSLPCAPSPSPPQPPPPRPPPPWWLVADG
jgi:hypothetical protein